MTEKKLPPHFPVGAEERIYEAWLDAGAFAPGEGDPYVVVMPPPNVTGVLHLGHALDHFLQDVLVRFYRMRGRAALWIPGVDHAGIATQMMVEKRLWKSGKNPSHMAKNDLVAEGYRWKKEAEGNIVRQLQRLGVSVYWPAFHFTLDEDSSRAVRRAFVELYDRGLVYRDHRLVNWDPKFASAISDLEVRHVEVRGKMWFISYPFVDEEGGLVIATTRPETLFADRAVAVHPEDKRMREHVGKKVRLPLTDRVIPVIADADVDPKSGTGAVKISPSHDFQDFEIGKRHGLEPLVVMDVKGRLNEAVPEPWRGMERFRARKAVEEALKQRGLLVKVEEYRHSVPHGDRSGVPLEPILTQQWFFNVAPLAEEALRKCSLERKPAFVPRSWAKVYETWCRNIQPWCISRQLWWGHPIPVWYGPDGKIFAAESLNQAEEKAKAHYGKTVKLSPSTEVLDTWFSSALWPLTVLGWPDRFKRAYFPTSLLVTGFDIIFFWVARMVFMSLAFEKRVPFEVVYMHPLVKDPTGKKMSKTKGNVQDPLELMEANGADALRYTLVGLTTGGQEIRVGEGVVQTGKHFVNKLWNAAKLLDLLGARTIPDGKVRHPVNLSMESLVDAWAEDVAGCLEEYQFSVYVEKARHFFWGLFCDDYLEIAKVLVEEDAWRDETRTVLARSFQTILKVLHPLLPFVTEYLWGEMVGDGLLATKSWPEKRSQNYDPQSFLRLRCIWRKIRSVRTWLGIKEPMDWAIPSLKVDFVHVLERVASVRIHGEARASDLSLSDRSVGELYLRLPERLGRRGDEIREDLNRRLSRTRKEREAMEAKLSNDDFVKRAPPKVVCSLKEHLHLVEQEEEDLIVLSGRFSVL